MTPAEIKHFKNLGAEAERRANRRIVRNLRDQLAGVLEQIDKHVAAVSKRKGGLGRK